MQNVDSKQHYVVYFFIWLFCIVFWLLNGGARYWNSGVGIFTIITALGVGVGGCLVARKILLNQEAERRRRAKLCVHCAYPLEESQQRCPECGTVR